MAAAAEPTGSASLASTLLSGPVNAASDAADARWNPTLQLALRGTVGVRHEAWSALATWGIWRDQTFCDTCDGGYRPGNLGGTRLLDSEDLMLSGGRAFGPLVARLDLVLPASRDALVCNPMIGAPGLTVLGQADAGPTTLGGTASVRRPFYAFDAAPVGRCSPDLAVEHTPWAGERFAGSNPTLSVSTSAIWTDPHALLGHVDALTTRLTVGVVGQRRSIDDAVVVETLSGPVTVGASHRPVVWAVPWSMSAGWSVSEPLDLSLTLSNALPAVLADPGAAVRNLPATTAVTLAATTAL